MKGILTIAVGEPLYGRMAVALAVSIKQNSRTPIGIIYSKSAFKGLEDYLAVFDHHILIEDNVTPNKQVMELKVSLDLMTPYSETLFLDADTIINPSRSVDEMFLQSSDFTMFNIGISPLSGEPSPKYRAWAKYEDIAKFFNLPLDTKIPQVNSSVIFWRASLNSSYVFGEARKVLKSGFKAETWREQFPDELAFNIACAITGVLPHKKSWRPIYLHILNDWRSKEYIIDKYIGLSIIGTEVKSTDIIKIYNDFVSYYFDMAGFKEKFTYTPKLADNKRIIAYYHVYMKNAWKSIVTEQYEIMKRSGLYYELQEIHVGVIGAQEDTKDLIDILDGDKFKFHYWGVEGYERPTITLMHELSKTVPSIILYFHTKGASKVADNVAEWRDEMNTQVLLNWRDCIAHIRNGYDTCGVNWIGFYEGNFWWSRTNYIRRLDAPKVGTRYEDEEWIASGTPNYISIPSTKTKYL